MSVIALVPARGGSKSIPQKNIIDFMGKPLIAWTIESALKSELIDRVVVSTDCEKIAAIARKYGAEVPFVRPSSLAEDSSLDFPVFEHAIGWLEENERADISCVVHLRPTTPLRPEGLIDHGISKLLGSNADSLRAVCEPLNNPFKMWKIKDNGLMVPLVETEVVEAFNQPRQALPACFWQTGTLDVIKINTLKVLKSMTGNNVLSLVIDKSIAVDIDDEASLKYAEEICALHGM